MVLDRPSVCAVGHVQPLTNSFLSGTRLDTTKVRGGTWEHDGDTLAHADDSCPRHGLCRNTSSVLVATLRF